MTRISPAIATWCVWVCVAALVVCGCTAGLVAPPALVALHGTRGPGAAIVDGHGRTVLLRAISVNQLGDYYADQPALPTVEPLTEADFTQIAALGFNAVRLAVSWSSLQPHPGAVDGVYIQRIHEAVRWAAAHRLYVIIDMHQDAWGKFIASPPGLRCPSGSSPAIGWDGAPLWATLTDGKSTCRGSQREISGAVERAWENFYADTHGILTELVRTWSTLAASFAADPEVAGFDLLNEPHPGSSFGAVELAPLSRYYARALAAIRAAEKSAPGGFAHLVFFEPMVTWFLLSQPAVPPSFSSDAGLVYAPHLYAGSLSDNHGTVIADGFAEATREADAYGTPWWSGEWGWFDAPVTDAPLVAEYARHEDTSRVGGAWWDWKQACGDPHQINSPGAAPRPISDGLVRLSCPSGAPLGSPAEFTTVLSRPYPRSAPGRLTLLTTDPVTAQAEVAGTSSAAGTMELWVPGAARPTVRGARHLTFTRLGAGWVVEAALSAGRYDVFVTR